MARVKIISKAQKSTKKRICNRTGCGHEVQPGETYYIVQFRFVSLLYCYQHTPKPSETVSSSKVAALYAAKEQAELDIVGLALLPDIAQACRDAAQAAADVAQEYQDSMDSMPEQLQESSGMQEKIESCEQWQQELETAAEEIDQMEMPSDGDESNSDAQTAEDVLDAARQVASSALDSLEL